jgi:hypothetical protein
VQGIHLEVEVEHLGRIGCWWNKSQAGCKETWPIPQVPSTIAPTAVWCDDNCEHSLWFNVEASISESSIFASREEAQYHRRHPWNHFEDVLWPMWARSGCYLEFVGCGAQALVPRSQECDHACSSSLDQPSSHQVWCCQATCYSCVTEQSSWYDCQGWLCCICEWRHQGWKVSFLWYCQYWWDEHRIWLGQWGNIDWTWWSHHCMCQYW